MGCLSHCCPLASAIYNYKKRWSMLNIPMWIQQIEYRFTLRER